MNLNQNLKYETFDKLCFEDKSKTDIETEVVLKLLYCPLSRMQLYTRINKPQNEISNAIENLINTQIIEETEYMGFIFIGISKKLRDEFKIKKNNYVSETCYFRINEEKKIITLRFPIKGMEVVNVDIPLINFYYAINTDFKALNINMPLLEYNNNNLTLPIRGNSEKIYRYVSEKDRLFVLERQNYKCNNCGCEISDNPEEWDNVKVAHIDHIHPFALRDSYQNGPSLINELENLQGLCSDCNRKKGKMIN